jgi:hypothetical protein
VRKRLAVALALPVLLAAPGTASADVIFDPADADDLAASLAEAYTDQGVCYGWQVTVNDVSTTDESVGSNFGAGKPVSSGACDKTVEFHATITYTSESSESEDSASYDVTSTPSGVTRDDLDALGIDFDDLTGEDPDVAIGKAVIALPLLAADKGVAEPLSATPDNATAPADAQLTDSPGSDWWRDRGGMLLWGLGLLAAGGVFVWWILWTNRRTKRPAYPSYPSPAPESTLTVVPDTVPAEWAEPSAESGTAEEAPTSTEEADASEKPATSTEDSGTDPTPAPKPQAAAVDPEPDGDVEQESAGRPEPAADAAEAESSVEPAATSTEDSEADPASAPKPQSAAADSEPDGDSEQESADRPAPAAEAAESSSADPAATSTEDQARPAPSDREDKE